MDLVSPILDVVKCIMTPTCSHVEHHRLLGERMDELRIKLETLYCRKEDRERSKQTEVGSDQEVKKEVELWLQRAEAIIAEIQKVEEKFQNVKFMCRGCLSKRVLKKIVEVDKFLEYGKFPEGIAINKPPGRGMILPTDRNAEGDQNRVKFRERLEEKLMGFLMGDEVGIIGVCGPGGVGKTTLAKSINNKVSNLKDSKFDKVIWAPVSYPFSIVKLQDTIAGAMNENLPGDRSEDERAAKLFEIMGKRKFLLILDDVWDKFSFHDVGIPVPTTDNKCKVVTTSRSSQLCKYTGCNDDGLVELKTLSEKESFNLFLDTVGHDVIEKIPYLEETLRDLVKECAGLPLAIVAIARSMRTEDDISGWRNALNELRNRVKSVKGWDDEIFERLKFSYHRLKDEELQNCFLFCSLYPKSWEFKKEKLIECWIDGGLIKQMKTRKEMVDRGRALLNRLISDCLIEEAGKDLKHKAQVRMHDVMRDMALRVAGSRFMVKAGEKVTKITANGEWTEHLQKVSMIGSGISKISPDFCPNFPKLSTLLLPWNGYLRMIPDSFFKGMLSLEYLDLSSTSISSLPNSISNLINLTTLLLCDIEELKYLPSLAGLKALKKLDLVGAGIKAVPEGIDALVNLQYLDLRCPYLVEFPIRILKDLSLLEFFAVNFSSCWSNTDFVMEAKQIPRLKMLEAFIGEFHNLEGLKNYVKFFHQLQKPTQYILRVEKNSLMMRTALDQCVNFSRKVKMRSLDLQGRHVSLPNDLQQLDIRDCRGVESLSEIFSLNTETDLRSCVIEGGSFECIIDLGSSSSVCSLFDKCEVLKLFCMDDLSVLVNVAPQAISAPSTSTSLSMFSNIKRVEVSGCPRIKKLFPSNLLKGLQNLEEINVLNCWQMEEIFEIEEDDETVTINLAKLRKLVLKDLPGLKSICSAKGVMVCDSIQVIKISECRKLHRIPLHLPFSSPPPCLKRIKLDSRVTWEVLEWDNPTTKEILLPFFKPRSDTRFLTRVFDEETNNFVKRFQDQNLTSYKFLAGAIDDDSNSSSSSNVGDEDDSNYHHSSDYSDSSNR